MQAKKTKPNEVISRAQASIAKKVYIPKSSRSQVKVSSSGNKLAVKKK